MWCVIQQQAMGTYGRVYPSGLMFALVMGRTASGPIHAPLAESENDTRTKESRFSIMNEDWIVSEKRRGEDGHVRVLISRRESRTAYIVSRWQCY